MMASITSLTAAILLSITAVPTVSDDSCPVPGLSSRWAMSLCMLRNETDDLAHPDVSECFQNEWSSLDISFDEDCETNILYKSAMCSIRIENDRYAGTLAMCVFAGNDPETDHARSELTPSPLRIFNGDTAIGGFREAFGKAESTDVLVCRDVLICGPLSEFTSIEDWRPGRQAFWRDVLGEKQDSAVLSGEDPMDVSFADSWRDLYGDTDALKSADEIEVWIGCALSDQVLLTFIAFLVDLYDIDRDRLSVVQMREVNDRTVRGIGEPSIPTKPGCIRR